MTRTALSLLPRAALCLPAWGGGTCGSATIQWTGGNQWTLPLTVPLSELPPYKPVPPPSATPAP